MTQDVEELPVDELTRVLFRLGGRKLVFVEGTDDEETLNSWFQERLGDVFFYPVGGVSAVKERLEQITEERRDVSAYGIRDRDFSRDEEVKATLNDSTARLFTMVRYSIENYMLEPQALLTIMDDFLGRKNPVYTPAQVEAKLLEIGRQLHALMGANWLLIENGQKKLPAGYNQTGQAQIAQHVATALNCTDDVADALLTERMAIIQPALDRLETAHTQISGKHLLHHFYRFIVSTKGGLSPDHLRRFLIRRIKEIGPIHPDIRFIVEKRILGDP